MNGRNRWLLLGVMVGVAFPAGCGKVRHAASAVSANTIVPVTLPEKIVAGARAQIGDRYVADYYVIPYPSGDVPVGQGACTDVVIRALRRAGIDLQKEIHEDIKRNFAAYPAKWRAHRPDTNIDHRRVPNIQTYFRRHRATVTAPAEWLPGDIVTWQLRSGKDHCGIISDRKNSAGIPLVIHNIGRCAEEDCLNAWKITGHFRVSSNATSEIAGEFTTRRRSSVH